MIKFSNGTPLKCLFYKKDNNNIQLIEANEDDHSNYCIKVWDFNLIDFVLGEEIETKIGLNYYNDMCLINNNKLLVQDGEEIEIVYLDKNDEFKVEQIEKIKEMDISEEDDNCSFVKMDHPFLGECLICKIRKNLNLISLK